jgi:membrane protein required for colicin V production
MLAVLAGTTLFGAWKGMVWQLASLGALFVSGFVAIRFSGRLAPAISQEQWGQFAAMLVLYMLTSLVIWLLFRLVAGFLDRLKLREWDRQLGVLFGLAKGLLLCLVITFFAVTLSESARRTIATTYSGRGTSLLIEKTLPIMPQEARGLLGQYLLELNQKLDPNTLPAPPPDAPPPTLPAAPSAAPANPPPPPKAPGRLLRGIPGLPAAIPDGAA